MWFILSPQQSLHVSWLFFFRDPYSWLKSLYKFLICVVDVSICVHCLPINILQVYTFKKLPIPTESGLEELSTKLSKFNISIREYAQSLQEGSHQSSRLMLYYDVKCCVFINYRSIFSLISIHVIRYKRILLDYIKRL